MLGFGGFPLLGPWYSAVRDRAHPLKPLGYQTGMDTPKDGLLPAFVPCVHALEQKQHQLLCSGYPVVIACGPTDPGPLVPLEKGMVLAVQAASLDMASSREKAH